MLIINQTINTHTTDHNILSIIQLRFNDVVVSHCPRLLHPDPYGNTQTILVPIP